MYVYINDERIKNYNVKTKIVKCYNILEKLTTLLSKIN